MGNLNLEISPEFSFTTVPSSRNFFRRFAQNWGYLITLKIDPLPGKLGISFERLEINLKILLSRVPLAN